MTQEATLTVPIQTVLSALIVAAAFFYAVWALMPGAGRLAVRRRLGLTPKAVGSGGGCAGCGGCEASGAAGRSAAGVDQAQPIQVYLRQRRDGGVNARRQ